MKKIYALILLINSFYIANAQNTFPATGNVGIGTTSPLEALDVRGRFYLGRAYSDPSGWGYSYFYWQGHSLVIGTKPGVYAHNRIELKPGGSIRGGLYSALEMYYSPTLNEHISRVLFNSNGNSYINGGNLGIGTTTPQAKLAVNGNILAKEVKVKTDIAVPDYVFEEGYKLLSPSELENYIKKYKHLPEVPSAAEIQEKGLDLAAMNLLLLKKIEELTLLLIEQDKKITALMTNRQPSGQ